MQPLILLSPNNGEMYVFPAKIVPDAYHLDRVQPAKPIEEHVRRIDDAAFCALIMCFCQRYFDESLAKSYRSDDSCEPSFDYYLDNVYTYEQMYAMLAEIEQTADAVLHEDREHIPDEMVSCINQYLFGIYTPKVSSEELLVRFKNEIAEYMRAFCKVIRDLMANAPDCQFFDFQGP